MSINDLAPCAGAHAVQAAVFAIEWANPLSIEALRQVRALYDTSDLRRQFPNPPQEQRQLSVRIDSQGFGPMGATASADEISGYQFLKLMGPLQSARALEVTGARLLYIVYDYTRWEAVMNDVLKALEGIAHPLTGLPVTAIGLQYTDVFHWRGDPAHLNLQEVFHAETSLLPPDTLKRRGLWHSHHGYLEDITEPLEHKLLENVNVDIVDNGGQRSISVVTSHRATLGKPLHDSRTFMDALPVIFAFLHQRNKEALSKLFSEAVSQKIKLNGSPQ